MAGNVLDLSVEIRVEIVTGGVADEAGPGAITAVGGATVGDQKQHPVGIPVDEAGDRRMRILAARILHFPG